MLRWLGNSIRNNMTVEEFFEKWWTPKELPQNGFNKTAMLDFAEMYHKEMGRSEQFRCSKCNSDWGEIRATCFNCGHESEDLSV